MKKCSSGCFSPTCFSKATIILFITGFSVIFSCTSALYLPTVSHETPTASLSQLQEGRKLYVKKCGNCHTLYLPEKYSKKEWQHWLDEMQEKAVIDTLQKQQILLYLTKGV